MNRIILETCIMLKHNIEGNIDLSKFLNEIPSPGAVKNQGLFS
jgi:hypothetical protein